jgi:DNA replication protein DnaC
VSQRYLKTSIVITTNRGVAAWGEILGDTTVAAAMLDRLLHRSSSSITRRVGPLKNRMVVAQRPSMAARWQRAARSAAVVK